MNPHEHQYRQAGRVLTILFVLYVPVVGILGFALVKLSGVNWPVFILAGMWMAVILLFTVKRFLAYYRWTGRHPFRGLR